MLIRGIFHPDTARVRRIVRATSRHIDGVGVVDRNILSISRDAAGGVRAGGSVRPSESKRRYGESGSWGICFSSPRAWRGGGAVDLSRPAMDVGRPR
ncbi:hypothetical protein EVAR_28567_1 [Eumeta japonica]|uniref:Uncharacterized protein n=1 Tax=Eumeta variegata TaxID=151549 RepID=A0A4C1UY39_EUMVA|nr:hypothetical protein EVAR_28567_1 [Eumeta japonica]